MMNNSGYNRGTRDGKERKGLPLQPSAWVQQVREDFYVPSKDEKGHSEVLATRVPPRFLEQISTVIDSKEFPYKRRGDLIRHAIVIHLEYLEQIHSSPNSIMSKIRAMNAIAEFEEQEQSSGDNIARVVELANGAINKGNQRAALELIVKMKESMDSGPECNWKRHWSKEFESKTKPILDRMRKADRYDDPVTKDSDGD